MRVSETCLGIDRREGALNRPTCQRDAFRIAPLRFDRD
jgi:hypothetical protein